MNSSPQSNKHRSIVQEDIKCKFQGIWSFDVPYVTEYYGALNLNQHQIGHFTSYLVSSKL